MKKQQCFYTALLMSLIMIVWSNVFVFLINDQADLRPGSFCLLLLQAVLVMKYVSGTLLAMPGNIKLKQVIAGFFCADLLIGIPLTYGNSSLVFSAEILIAQLVLVVFYSLTERRAVQTASQPVWEPNNKLILQGV
jgi:lysylphosphatidylglycerol synthetase-like protein (DUF2156 family)